MLLCVSLVLSFLVYLSSLLERGLSHTTIKEYAASLSFRHADLSLASPDEAVPVLSFVFCIMALIHSLHIDLFSVENVL